MALPEAIRDEVLQQVRSDQRAVIRVSGEPSDWSTSGTGSGTVAGSGGGGSSSAAEEMDNASFLASLSPELRSEVLLTADPAFLASLPPHLVAETQQLREAAVSNWQRQELLANTSLRVQEAIAGGAGGGGGEEDEDEEDEEDEDDYNDDDIPHAGHPRSLRGGRFDRRRNIATSDRDADADKKLLRKKDGTLK